MSHDKSSAATAGLLCILPPEYLLYACVWDIIGDGCSLMAAPGTIKALRSAKAQAACLLRNLSSDI